MIILIFIVLHLITFFKFGVEYTGYVQDTVVRDIYTLVEEVFQRPLLCVEWILGCSN